MVGDLGIAAWFHWFRSVPGYGGKTALVWLCFAVAVGGPAAFRILASRGQRTFGRIVMAGVVFVIAVIGLTRLPTSLQARNDEYKSDSGVSYRQAEQAGQAVVGAYPKFIAFLAKRIPVNARFYMITGPLVHTSGPQSWAQYVLMPRIEEYFHPCAARWIVLLDARGIYNVTGVKLEHPVESWKPGYSVTRNLDRCTS